MESEQSNIIFENDEIEEIDESSVDDLARIVSYNVANTVEVLVFKIKNDEIELKPEFQRDFVWDINRASLFIDSLLIGLPIPSIFLGKSKEDETYKVIDGQQRLKSVFYFIEGDFFSKGRTSTFSLINLKNREWNNKTFSELDPKYQRRIKNAILNTTVIEDIDSRPKVVHDIFQRLNTGGMSLLDQEIRNCIYNGPFNDTLSILNIDKNWRTLLGSPHPDSRLRDLELILRFYALFNELDSYEPSMREFLSNYQRNFKDKQPNINLFQKTTALIMQELGSRAFILSKTVNKSICDAVLVSIAQILSTGDKIEKLKDNHLKLLQDEEFVKYVSSGTSTQSSVKGRINLARQYYLGLK